MTKAAAGAPGMACGDRGSPGLPLLLDSTTIVLYDDRMKSASGFGSDGPRKTPGRVRLLGQLDEALHGALGMLHLDDLGYWEPALKGIAQQDIHALVALSTEPECTAKHLGVLIQVPKSTLTGILDRLERRKCLRRETDPDNRRSAILRMTERGRQLVAAHDRGHERAVHHAASTLTETELSQFVRLLAKVVAGVAGREEEKR